MAITKQGIISKVYGAWYELLAQNSDGTIILPPLTARLRGRLRLKKKERQRHLLMVGDKIEYTEDKQNLGTYIIEKLIPRHNAVQRSNRSNIQGLGANLSRAVLLVSLCDPPPRPGFIDRFLCACIAGNVEPIILFSKIDLLTADSVSMERFLIQLYQNLGFKTCVSNLLGDAEPERKKLIQSLGKGNSLLCGSSGTGKSTFLNLIIKKSLQKTSAVSHATGKGRHTTTNSSLFLFPGTSASIIDTPGVKEWGLEHLNVNEILNCYPELQPHLLECKFSDCLHSPKSQGCAIQDKFNISLQKYKDSKNKWSLLKGDCMHPVRIRNLNNILTSLTDSRKIRTGDYVKATGRFRETPKNQPNEI